jgi:predicted KAP-like P-loop ATPase
LGQTGVGKSTWINSIAHYLTYGSLDDALEGEPMYLVPSSFTIVDEKSNQTYKKLRIVVGEENDTESFKQGESATR